MFTSFILSLREGLEAALIVGIVLGLLQKMERESLNRNVWRGVFSAVGISIMVAFGLQMFGASLEGAGEEIFEGITMILAACVLTWMIFWMMQRSANLKNEITESVQNALGTPGKNVLFFLAFVAVLREGIELALFLTAAAFTSGSVNTLLGAVLGLAAAIFLGWVIFKTSIKLNLSNFFKFTGGLLLLFAAGLIAHGVHEFNEVGLIPPLVEHVWDINYFLDEKSPAGQFLKALFGYNGDPSLTEVIAYFGYLAVILGKLRGNKRK